MKKLLMLALALMIAVGIFATDMAAIRIAGPSAWFIDNPIYFNITVKNNGAASQSSYTIHLKKYGAERISSLLINTPLAAGASVVQGISWTPRTADVYNLVGEVEVSGDSDATNNETQQKIVGVYAFNITQLLVGTPSEATKTNTLPVSVNYKNCVTETIYTAREMQTISGMIRGLVYFNNFTEEVLDNHIKIWAKNTSVTNLSDGWLPFDGYTLVYDGLVDFPLSGGSVTIPFTTSIEYTGSNLAVRVNRVDTDTSASGNVFYYINPRHGNNRSRYVRSNTDTYDPENPGVDGTLTSRIPVTGLWVSDAEILDLAQPELTITQDGDTVTIIWEEIDGANSYMVFASDVPDYFSDDPIDTVYTNSYTVDVGTDVMKFYKVVASSLE